jgi:hypothetical protein
MISAGDVISYLEMCQIEGASLQRGMNFHLRGNLSVVLMSLRRGSPYADRIEDNGRTLIYEGHDAPKSNSEPNPKGIDQPQYLNGSLTQNGLFFDSAMRTKQGKTPAELVKVYEKIRAGIWAFDGVFELVDAWMETIDRRRVFKFKLVVSEAAPLREVATDVELRHDRVIPSSVKLEVWKRDGGKCVSCGSRENLHFDHIIPYSQGGSSLVSKNVQLLCAKHNLEKHDKII